MAFIRPAAAGFWRKTTVPNFPVELIPDHPQAQGLVAAWIPGLGVSRDYGQNNYPLTLIAAPSLPLLLPGPSMSFNGTSQALSTRAINLTSVKQLSLIVLQYQAVFGNNDGLTAELSPNVNTNTGGFIFDTNNSSPANTILIAQKPPSGYNEAIYNPPAVGWHWYGLVFDQTVTGAAQTNLWIDGVLQSAVSRPDMTTNTSGFGNYSLYFMSRAASSLFNAGSLAAVFLYTGLPDQLAAAKQPFAMFQPKTERLWYTAPSGGTTTLIYGRAQSIGASRLSGAFSASIPARSLGMFTGRNAPSGSAGIIGRSSSIFTGRAPAFLSYIAFGHSVISGTSRAAPSGTAPLLGRSAESSTARAAPSGTLGLFGRTVSAFTGQAAAFFGYILAGRATAAQTGRAAPTGAVPLSARANAQSSSRATFTGFLGLLGRATGKITGRASAFFGYVLYGRASAASRASGINTLTLTMSAKASAGAPARVRFSGLTSLLGRASAGAPARGSTVNTLSLTGRANAAGSGMAHAIGTVALTGRAAASAAGHGFLSGVVILVSIVGRAASAFRGVGTLFTFTRTATRGAALQPFDRGAALRPFDRGASLTPPENPNQPAP